MVIRPKLINWTHLQAATFRFSAGYIPLAIIRLGLDLTCDGWIKIECTSAEKLMELSIANLPESSS